VLIRACAVRRDYANHAISLYERMRLAGYMPTVMTYDALLMAMGHGDDLAAIDATYADAIAQYPDDARLRTRLLRTYACHTLAFARQGACEDVLARAAALVESERVRLGGDASAIASLLGAQHVLLCAANRIARANAIVDSDELRASGGVLQRHRLYAQLGMYRRTRRAADAIALSRRALAARTLDGTALELALSACARAYWLKSGVALWRDASRAGVRAQPTAGGVRAFVRVLRGARRDAEADAIVADANEGVAEWQRNVVDSIPTRFRQLPLTDMFVE
jgi:hypothetical protein